MDKPLAIFRDFDYQRLYFIFHLKRLQERHIKQAGRKAGSAVWTCVCGPFLITLFLLRLGSLPSSYKGSTHESVNHKFAVNRNVLLVHGSKIDPSETDTTQNSLFVSSLNATVIQSRLYKATCPGTYKNSRCPGSCLRKGPTQIKRETSGPKSGRKQYQTEKRSTDAFLVSLIPSFITWVLTNRREICAAMKDYTDFQLSTCSRHPCFLPNNGDLLP